MRSKTSFFNATLYRQSLRLTAPVGLGMLITWMLIYPMTLFNSLYGGYQSWETTHELEVILWRNTRNVFDAVTITGLIFGLILAVSLFHYLSTPRSVNMLHALPLRREGLFLTQYAVGVTYIVLTLVATALMVLALQASAGVVFLDGVLSWLWMSLLITVFFFSFAVFCMMFAGVTWAGAAYFAIFNAVTSVLYAMYMGLMQTFAYGVNSTVTPGLVDWLTPVLHLIEGIGIFVQGSDLIQYTYEIYGQNLVLGYALAGVVLTLGALAVYRRRPSESASDVVAIGWAKPLFRFGMALCSGLIFGLGLYMIVWDNFRTFGHGQKFLLALASMALVGVVGLIVAEMLMEKSMRIGWRWTKPGLAVVVLFGLLGCTIHFDFFGIEGYVPQTDAVGGVSLRIYGQGTSTQADLDDPQEIALALNLHRTILVETDRQEEMADLDYGDGTVTFNFTYYDQEGLNLAYRSYTVAYYREDVEQPTPLMESAQALLVTQPFQYGVIWSYSDVPSLPSYMELSLYDSREEYVRSVILDEEEVALVYEGLLRDVTESNLALLVLDPDAGESYYRNDLSMTVETQRLSYDDATQESVVETTTLNRGIYLRPQMVHTVAALETLEAVQQYPLVLESNLYRD